MIEVYKILHRIYDPEVSPKLLLREGTTRGNKLKLFKMRATSRLRQRCFSIRVVKGWNCLSNYVVEAPSLNAFKIDLTKNGLPISSRTQNIRKICTIGSE